LKFPLLALLAAGPAHGYELKQRFDARFSAVWPPVNIGQVYATLQRLERDYLVRGSEVEQSGRPAKTVYEITEAGLKALDEWLRDVAPGPRIRDEFFLKMILARLAGLADPQELLDSQRLVYLQELRDLNALADRTGGDPPGTLLLIEGAVLHLQADLKWLDLCEDVLAKGELL
jgi:DNA-binding PadR family transcriptional regulator